MQPTIWKPLGCALAALACAGLAAAPRFSPETSSLFVDFVDPDCCVPGRMLKPGLLASVQQSTYFVQKCITDDCRFMVVMHLDKEQPGPKVPPRRFAVIDFETDTVTKLEDFRVSPGGSYFIDTAADKIYTVNATDGFRVHDLTSPGMKGTAVCPLPADLAKLGSIQYLCTHLTLTKGRDRAFLESCVRTPEGKKKYVQGTVELATGKYEPWSETYFFANHGQINPARDDIAMCAWEEHWLQQGREFRKNIGFWPRIWHLHRNGRLEFQPARRCDEEPTHETWASDGKGHYWCSKPFGVWYQDLATANQMQLSPLVAEHPNVSEDLNYVVFDQKPKGWWRGSPQRIGFYNRKTGRHAWIYATSAALCPRSRESRLHPDGHPQFCGNDRYVVCTLDRADGRMDIIVTPVKSLVDATTRPDPAGANFMDWPAGKDPGTLGVRLVNRFLEKTPLDWTKMHSARSKTITYPTVCTWFGALEFASTLADEPAARKLRGPLASRYGKFFGEWASHVPPANHVDNSMFGCLPLSVYAYTGDARALEQGLAMADAQWAEPKPEDKEINGMFNYEKRMELWKGGYTPQTRLWMDDMFMITILQLNAFRQSERRVYAERASHEMVLYLDKMQRADGLFDHGPGAPFTWARGNGWMAAGTAMLLKSLPVDDPNRERILAGFRKMMAGLLRHQRPDGLWGQLVDDPTIWPETSGSAMFAYAFIEGAKHGWIDPAVYAPAARKAFLALQDYIEPNGDVRDVCCGTNIGNSREYYDKRRRITGDLHGQAPLIWCCAALAEYVRKVSP